MGPEKLEVYQIAMQISDLAWSIYKKIPQEFKFGIGQQFLNSSDSVGANIAEGFGRYHYKDSVKFYYIARGSLFETEWWVNRLFKRDILSADLNKQMISLIQREKVKLNKFISSTKALV